MTSLVARRRRYWRWNRRLILPLLGLWFAASFVVTWYARELSSIDFFGWPFSYWVGAQGAQLVYLVIVVVYAVMMKRFDQSLRDPGPDESGGAPTSSGSTAPGR